MINQAQINDDVLAKTNEIIDEVNTHENDIGSLVTEVNDHDSKIMNLLSWMGLVEDYVIETGSNANGSYEKWFSGKLVQWGVVSRTLTTSDKFEAFYYASTGVINFPISFSNNGYYTSFSSETSTGIHWISFDNNGGKADGLTLRIFNAANQERTYKIRWEAVGTWK